MDGTFSELLVPELIDHLRVVHIYIFLFTFAVCLVFMIILFPFCVYVNNANRERDEATLIFAFSNHFYKMVCKTYAMLIVLVISVGSTYYFGLGQMLLIHFTILISVSIFFALHIIAQVFHLLISILAVLKFLLYFVPKTENFIVLAQKTIHKRIRWIYFVYGVKEAYNAYGFLGCVFGQCRKQEKWELEFNYTIGFFTLKSVLIVSSFLYVPIVISIKKLSNLRVVQETQPQKYIIWQAMITMMVKSISLPVATVYLYYDNQYEIDITLVILFLIITDIILLPLIIQISYLSCNKRNVEALVQILFCCNLCKSTVEPDTVENYDSV